MRADFTQKSYEIMRAELTGHIAFRRRVETELFVSTIAVFAWYFSFGGSVPVVILLVAPLAALGSIFRWYFVNDKIRAHVDFLKNTEDHVLPNDGGDVNAPMGPQQFFSKHTYGQAERNSGLYFLFLYFAFVTAFALISIKCEVGSSECVFPDWKSEQSETRFQSAPQQS